MGLLDGKSVIITGSGRGIGAGCAQGAARQGANVVVNDVDEEPVRETVAAIAAEGGSAIPCVADVTSWSDVERLVQTCLDEFGAIDGLVNNAAISNTATIEHFDPEAAQEVVSINVLGPMYCTAQVVPHMLARGSGSIVNVTSGAHMGIPTLGIYGATKGAVASMTYTWALELADTGVRVNALSPFGATRMMDPELSEEERQQMLARLPPPENNSPVVEFLLSDRAAGVNGQIVRKDFDEISLYTHPALLLPSVERRDWTAEAVAEVFDHELADRLIPCGVQGMEHLPVPVSSGYWARLAAEEPST